LPSEELRRYYRSCHNSISGHNFPFHRYVFFSTSRACPKSLRMRRQDRTCDCDLASLHLRKTVVLPLMSWKNSFAFSSSLYELGQMDDMAGVSLNLLLPAMFSPLALFSLKYRLCLWFGVILLQAI